MSSDRMCWTRTPNSALVTLLALGFVAALPCDASAAPAYGTVEGIGYHPAPAGEDAYRDQQCRLDLYHPAGAAGAEGGFATVVWFHGGGLTGGKRAVPAALKGQGFAVAGVGYRLYPKVKAPTYIEDAAAVVAWTFKNIARYGGDPARIYLSGHSAGGYLVSMLALDRRWLGAHGINPDRLAGAVPFSSHTITHFTVRKERGIKGTQPVVDDLAPLYHVREDAPELVLITGDRDLEMLGRYEENAYLWRMMQVAGHTRTTLRELQGYDHGNMPEGAFPLLVRHIRSRAGK